MKTWGKMFARGRRLRLSAGRGCIRKPVAARGFVSGRGPKTNRTAGRNLFLDSRRSGFGRDEAKRKVCGTIPLARLCLRPSIAQSHFVHEKGGFSWMKLGFCRFVHGKDRFSWTSLGFCRSVHEKGWFSWMSLRFDLPPQKVGHRLQLNEKE
jgi:hypothetical protein